MLQPETAPAPTGGRSSDSDVRQEWDNPERLRRRRLRMHRSRTQIYLAAGLTAGVFRALGTLHAPLLGILVLVLSGVLSALALLVFHRRPRQGWALRLADLSWLTVDTLFVTIGVAISGNGASPWFLWYLANFSSAAFVLSPRGVLLVALGNATAYLGLLAFTGEVSGFDASLLPPLQRLVFLHAAAIFFLQGVVKLRQSRRTIHQLQEEESRKVAELVRLNAALDQRSHELAAASATIAAASEQKSRFLASMSHELRTPLNSIIGFSDLLLDRLQPIATPRYLGFVRNIHDSGQYLLGLINDILDLSKIEAGRMELAPETVQVAQVVDGICEAMKGMASTRRIEMVKEVAAGLPPLEADPVKLQQILYNLASNAVKYSPEGAAVTIAAASCPASAQALGKEAIEIRVTDSGPGIDPREHDLIFEEFRQAANSRGREGTGLGLALVKKFVELHGGSVRIESSPGAGSSFIVLLPCRAQRPD